MHRETQGYVTAAFGLLAFAVLLLLVVVGGGRAAQALGLAATRVVYLPIVMYEPTPTYVCPATSTNSYQQGDATQYDEDNPVRPAELHADKNIALRSYTPNTDPSLKRELVDYGCDDCNQDGSSRSPQLATLFAPYRVPPLVTFYRVYNWNWGEEGPPDPGTRGDPIASPPVTALGLGTTPGEPLCVPTSDYEIAPGMEVLVIYADEDTIALRYTREDSSASPGYTVHVDNICTDPNLLALYNQLDAPNGPRYEFHGSSYSYDLPNLPAGFPFGTARSPEIVVAIVDTGAFQDTRSCHEWWDVGYSGPCPPHD